MQGSADRQPRPFEKPTELVTVKRIDNNLAVDVSSDSGEQVFKCVPITHDDWTHFWAGSTRPHGGEAA